MIAPTEITLPFPIIEFVFTIAFGSTTVPFPITAEELI